MITSGQKTMKTWKDIIPKITVLSQMQMQIFLNSKVHEAAKFFSNLFSYLDQNSQNKFPKIHWFVKSSYFSSNFFLIIICLYPHIKHICILQREAKQFYQLIEDWLILSLYDEPIAIRAGTKLSQNYCLILKEIYIHFLDKLGTV